MEESKKLLFSILAVVVVLGLIGVAFYMDWKDLSEAKVLLQAKETEGKQLKQLIDVEIPRLKEQLAEATEKVADYEEALVGGRIWTDAAWICRKTEAPGALASFSFSSKARR